MNKTWIGIISLTLLLMACSQEAGQGAIKIGSILALTGDAAAIGQSMQRGIQVALDEINAQDGINGRPLEIIFEDGHCSGKDASNAANKLVNMDKVPAIIGGLCSPETLGAAPIAEVGKAVLLSPTSSNPGITNAGNYIFRDYPSDLFQGQFAAEYVYNQLGKKKAAILYCLNDWCTGLKDQFSERFKELGGEVVAVQEYEVDSKDLRTQLTKIKENDPEILYFLGLTDGSVVGLIQVKELALNIPLLGGDGWSDPDIPRKAKDAAENMMWTEPYAPISDAFKSKITAKFGQVDITLGTTQAYDATYLIANALKKVGPNGTKIKEELYKVKNYKGVSGTIGFDENGDLIEASYIVKTLKNGKVEDHYKP